MNILIDNIPVEMKEQRRWVNWKLEPRPKDPTKYAKIPYMPFATDRKAASTKSQHWSSFKQATYQYGKGLVDGIGFVLGEGYTLIDLDHCIVDGKVNDTARAIIKLFDSYTERSPSGNGVHIFVKTTLDVCNRRTDGIEMYSRDRYSTITGQCNYPKPVQLRDVELAQFMNEYLPEKLDTPKVKRESKQYAPIAIYEKITVISQSDRQLWDKMFNCKQGEKYRNLFNGTHKIEDQSMADKLLLNGLAFWTSYDENRMRQMMLQSGLYRERWNEIRGATTWLDMQITESIAFARNGQVLNQTRVIDKINSN